MRVIKDYCDHCGTELNEMHDYCDAEIDIPCNWFKTDLCGKCVDELGSLVKKFCNVKEGDNK